MVTLETSLMQRKGSRASRFLRNIYSTPEYNWALFSDPVLKFWNGFDGEWYAFVYYSNSDKKVMIKIEIKRDSTLLAESSTYVSNHLLESLQYLSLSNYMNIRTLLKLLNMHKASSHRKFLQLSNL